MKKVFVVFKGITSQGKLSKGNIFEWAEKECQKRDIKMKGKRIEELFSNKTLKLDLDNPSTKVMMGKTNRYLQDEYEKRKEKSLERQVNEDKS